MKMELNWCRGSPSGSILLLAGEESGDNGLSGEDPKSEPDSSGVERSAVSKHRDDEGGPFHEVGPLPSYWQMANTHDREPCQFQVRCGERHMMECSHLFLFAGSDACGGDGFISKVSEGPVESHRARRKSVVLGCWRHDRWGVLQRRGTRDEGW